MSQNERRKPRAGRPRDEGVDKRILATTLDLLYQHGYDSLSVRAVAEASGVSKPTIYRRWSSKDDLVTSAVSTLALRGPALTDYPPWERLTAELEAFHEAISRPHGMSLLGNVVALENRHPHLIELYRAKVVSARRSRIESALASIRDAGELRPDLDLTLVMNMLIGYYYAAWISGAPIEPTWPRRCIQILRFGMGH